VQARGFGVDGICCRCSDDDRSGNPVMCRLAVLSNEILNEPEAPLQRGSGVVERPVDGMPEGQPPVEC
jgi:hypothetical protein